MKKKYGLLFLLCLLMFFCINIDGVKARENRLCKNDTKVKKAYTCDYSGSGTNFFEESKTSFSFTIVKDDDGNYCSAISNAQFSYKDNVQVLGLGDSSSDRHFASIRKVLEFDLSYKEIFNKMKSKKCPTLHSEIETSSEITSDYWSLKKYIIRDHWNFAGACNPLNECVKDMEGTNWRETSSKSAEEIIDTMNLSDDAIKEMIKNWAKKSYSFDPYWGESSETSCNALLTNDVASMLKNLFLILSVIGIILLVVLAMSDFIGAITSGEDGALTTAFKKTKNRVFAVIILLLLPFLVDWIVDFVNAHAYYEDSKFTIGNISTCYESKEEK